MLIHMKESLLFEERIGKGPFIVPITAEISYKLIFRNIRPTASQPIIAIPVSESCILSISFIGGPIPSRFRGPLFYRNLQFQAALRTAAFSPGISIP